MMTRFWLFLMTAVLFGGVSNAQTCSGCQLAPWQGVFGPVPYGLTVTYGEGTGSGACGGEACTPTSGCTIGFLEYTVTAGATAFVGKVRTGSSNLFNWTKVAIAAGGSTTFFLGEDGDDPEPLPCGTIYVLVSAQPYAFEDSQGLWCTGCVRGE